MGFFSAEKFSFIFWIVISISYTTYMAGKKSEDIAYSEFKEKIVAGDIAKIQVKGQKITGQYATEKEKKSAQTKDKEQQTQEEV